VRTGAPYASHADDDSPSSEVNWSSYDEFTDRRCVCAVKSTVSRSSAYLPLPDRRGDRDRERLGSWKGDTERLGRRGAGASMSRDGGVKRAGRK